ncbi:CpaD family pilus assembly protein [uncultured Sphingomonas sp.]|uniref:CpaD family pilus assembly protein n=1 Tax=uncultured Sphingomonas sp. TaxID=158754 RepID=UPI0035CA5F54
MKMRLVPLGSLVPALLLGGCMGTENRGLESVHQALVSRSDYALDLATAGGGLAPGEQRRLVGWMAALHVGYGDRIAIDDAGMPAARVHEQVGTVIAGYGLLLGDDAPISAAPIAPGTVRIVISRMKATVPGCPDWSRDEAHEFNSNTSSNYGCATNASLAAMIARPEDLVHGRSSDGTTDTAVSGKAITAFRKALPTGAQGMKTESTGGK